MMNIDLAYILSPEVITEIFRAVVNHEEYEDFPDRLEAFSNLYENICLKCSNNEDIELLEDLATADEYESEKQGFYYGFITAVSIMNNIKGRTTI